MPTHRSKDRKGHNAANAVGLNDPDHREEDIGHGQKQHRGHGHQRQQHPKGGGDALAAAEMVEGGGGVAQHRGHHDGGKGQHSHVRRARGQTHRQKALGQIEEQAEEPRRHAAVLKHIGSAGVVIVAEGAHVLVPPAEHDAAQQIPGDDMQRPYDHGILRLQVADHHWFSTNCAMWQAA